MSPSPAEVPYGTLDLMVLKTLQAMGPLHGYGIARRIEQAAQGSLALNQGTIYPALLRLEQKGWISSEWGTSENNRRARFYAITKGGKKQLAAETESWERTVAIMTPMLVSTPRFTSISIVSVTITCSADCRRRKRARRRAAISAASIRSKSRC